MHYIIDLNYVAEPKELRAIVTNRFGGRKMMSMPCLSEQEGLDKLPSFLMQIGLELHCIETQLQHEMAHPKNPVVTDPCKLVCEGCDGCGYHYQDRGKIKPCPICHGSGKWIAPKIE